MNTHPKAVSLCVLVIDFHHGAANELLLIVLKVTVVALKVANSIYYPVVL